MKSRFEKNFYIVDFSNYKIESLAVQKSRYCRACAETHEVEVDHKSRATREFKNQRGEKLGLLLFQFAKFNKKAFLGVNDFLIRLRHP